MPDYLVTRPEGYTEQPDFLNGAKPLDTLYTPHELLDNLQRIEQSRHRERVIHWGPRTLDLDLIFYDDRIISDARLQVPHPEAANRVFVLTPLSELAPYWMHPVLHRTVAQLLADNPEPV